MDEATLLAYRSLCTEEPSQHCAEDLPRLTKSERQVYRGLKAQSWGTNLRLEQERIHGSTRWRLLLRLWQEMYSLELWPTNSSPRHNNEYGCD